MSIILLVLRQDADGTLKPIHAVFNDCDRDRSGFLSKTEFVAAMGRLNCDATPSAISKMWRAKHLERLDVARHARSKGGPAVSVTPSSRDFSAHLRLAVYLCLAVSDAAAALPPRICLD